MIKVLEQLGFNDIIDGAEALSEAGKELIRNYRSFLFNNDATCNVGCCADLGEGNRLFV